MKAWLDVAVLRCPNCGHYRVDHVLLELQLGENGKNAERKIDEIE